MLFGSHKDEADTREEHEEEEYVFDEFEDEESFESDDEE